MWTDPELNPGCNSKKPATTHLSYDSQLKIIKDIHILETLLQ
jgi:hypothetical protein